MIKWNEFVCVSLSLYYTSSNSYNCCSLISSEIWSLLVAKELPQSECFHWLIPHKIDQLEAAEATRIAITACRIRRPFLDYTVGCWSTLSVIWSSCLYPISIICISFFLFVFNSSNHRMKWLSLTAGILHCEHELQTVRLFAATWYNDFK